MPMSSDRMASVSSQNSKAPSNFPDQWHSQAVQNKVAQMNKELVFGGDDGDCFYGGVAKQLGKDMTEVRQDLHDFTDGLLKRNSSQMLYGEINRDDLADDVKSGRIKSTGKSGEFLFGRLVAERYNRPVKILSYDAHSGKAAEHVFNPINSDKDPIILAYNGDMLDARKGGRFDAVMDKQQPQQNYNVSYVADHEFVNGYMQ